jgi:hypothetical protein
MDMRWMPNFPVDAAHEDEGAGAVAAGRFGHMRHQPTLAHGVGKLDPGLDLAAGRIQVKRRALGERAVLEPRIAVEHFSKPGRVAADDRPDREDDATVR